MGISSSVRDAANRYIEAGKFDAEVDGHFFGSPASKYTGKMEIQTNHHFLNQEYWVAGWKAIVNSSNGIYYPSNIS